MVPGISLEEFVIRLKQNVLITLIIRRKKQIVVHI
jgi:hypothetical protein